MAGPCVSVYVPRKPSSAEELRVRGMIHAIASTVRGDDFWIAQRPFFVRFHDPEADVAALVIDGWSPKGVISYCAMCNDSIDHLFLGMLCHRSAQLLEGRIALNDVAALTRDPSVLTYDGARPIKDHGYVVRPEFLGYWMGNPEFRLMK
jgi:Family of unknown function (DUF6368)